MEDGQLGLRGQIATVVHQGRVLAGNGKGHVQLHDL